MQIKKLAFILVALITLPWASQAQYADTGDDYRKYFIGSTFFMLGNLAPSNPPDFVQLNLGYRLTPKDVVSVELKTWKYAWSLGIPYGPDYEGPGLGFPGYIREFGVALAYQRFWWKGLYTGVHVMNALQSFVDKSGTRIDNGYQLFNTYRVGYHVKLFKDRFFIEPSLAITHRAFHTPMPEGFAVMDNPWPKFFFGEPGLHFGFNF
ncbi:MAG TPA: hypothetical protein DCE41_34790 [Cytophagales bacterium]|nr:hypothetical protein [Cytophagales bacterium]HAA20790.1 hypothetical protein [Cytophagales bacterium]HAP63256.1 hypothetical protein [Cytophagales bacterium]